MISLDFVCVEAFNAKRECSAEVVHNEVTVIYDLHCSGLTHPPQNTHYDANIVHKSKGY